MTRHELRDRFGRNATIVATLSGTLLKSVVDLWGMAYEKNVADTVSVSRSKLDFYPDDGCDSYLRDKLSLLVEYAGNLERDAVRTFLPLVNQSRPAEGYPPFWPTELISLRNNLVVLRNLGLAAAESIERDSKLVPEPDQVESSKQIADGLNRLAAPLLMRLKGHAEPMGGSLIPGREFQEARAAQAKREAKGDGHERLVPQPDGPNWRDGRAS